MIENLDSHADSALKFKFPRQTTRGRINIEYITFMYVVCILI